MLLMIVSLKNGAWYTSVDFIVPTVVVFIALHLLTLIGCVLLFDLQRAVPAGHRRIDSVLVWLLVIPLFSIIWNFFAYVRVAESFQSALSAKGYNGCGRVERSLGLAYAMAVAVSVIPWVGIVTGIAAGVCFVVYMVRMYGLQPLILSSAPSRFPIEPLQTQARS